MKGYKGFNPGMVCRGKQYAENTVFEEDTAEICKNGMHFCENPLDVLDYYRFVNNSGEFNGFAEVESLEDTQTDDGRKFCTTKLKVGAKLSFGGFVNACIDFTLEKIKPDLSNSCKFIREGHTQIGSIRDYDRIGSSGNFAQIGSSGNCTQIGSSGSFSKIVICGSSARIGSSGLADDIGSSGNYAQIGSSGDSAHIGSCGKSDRIASSGKETIVGSEGNFARIGSCGDNAYINSTGEASVICCAGHGSSVKAKKGSWITLSEWGIDNKGNFVPVCVKTEYVDGERIKEGVPYKLVDGEFRVDKQ